MSTPVALSTSTSVWVVEERTPARRRGRDEREDEVTGVATAALVGSSEGPSAQRLRLEGQGMSREQKGKLLIDLMGEGSRESALALLEEDVDLSVEDEEGRSTLLVAVKGGNNRILQRLLEKGAGAAVDTPDKEGWTPLLKAAWNGNVEAVVVLLNAGANKEIKFASKESIETIGATPLILAARRGEMAVIQALLDRGADIEATDKYGSTPLIHAAGQGRRGAVELLLQNGANLEKKELQWGKTALHYAVSAEDVETVRFLIEKGARRDVIPYRGKQTVLMTAVLSAGWVEDMSAFYEALFPGGISPAELEAKDEKGNTALLLAVEHKNLKIVKFLLDKGANLYAQNSEGNTAAILAADTAKHEMLSFLAEQHSERSGAAAAMSLEEAKFAKAAFVNTANNKGETPLMFAARRADGQMVNKLIDLGADIQAKSHNKTTVLMCAAQGRNLNIFRNIFSRFISLGLDPNAQNDEEETAFSFAFESGGVAIVEEFFSKAKSEGISETDFINTATTTGGKTLLMRASHASMLKYLLDKGAEVDKTDSEGYTALMRNIQHIYLDGVKLLLERGASPWGVTRQGLTSVMLAARSSDPAILESLLAALARAGREADMQAFLDKTDTEGRTALIHAASVYGSINKVQMLLDSGADPRVQMSDGLTALLRLMTNGEYGDPRRSAMVIKTFIDKGASVDGATNQTFEGWGEFARGGGITALMLACVHDYKDFVVPLLEAGANPWAKDAKGRTPLMYAAQNRSLVGMEELIEAAARHVSEKAASEGGFLSLEEARKLYVNQPDEEGVTALMVASEKAQTGFLTLLLRKGADVNIQDKKGFTALTHALAGTCLPKVVRTLLDAREINVHLKTAEEQSALHVLLNKIKGKPDSPLQSEETIQTLVSALVDKGGEDLLESRDKAARTPLLLAAEHFKSEPIGKETGVFRHLLALGADINVFNHLNATPLMYVVGKGSRDDVRLFMNMSVEFLNKKIQEGGEYSALMLAAMHGNLEAVKALIEMEGLDLSHRGFAETLAWDNDHEEVAMFLHNQQDQA